MNNDYLIIANVIKYLESNFNNQPKLSEIAKSVGISQFHLQRVFTRWVGISPKKFIQYLTIGHARKLLDDSRSILDSSFETGLSSPSRMHDLFVSFEAVTPGEYKSKGAGLIITYGIFESPFGWCLIATTERGICFLSFHNHPSADNGLKDLKSRWQNAIIIEDVNRTQHYFDIIFSEKKEKRQVNLYLKGSNFQIKVWEALLKIPSGFVCSYEDIARFIKKPNSSRAVGNAVAANPVSFLIPCHRVIKKIGTYGNYHWGPERKKAILGWEAAKKDKVGT